MFRARGGLTGFNILAGFTGLPFPMTTNDTSHSEITASHLPIHPSIFTLLIQPFGIITGYITVTLAFLFTKEGISIEKVAALVAAGVLPHIFKFLWAPILDSIFLIKTWYKIANIVSAVASWRLCDEKAVLKYTQE